MTTAPRLTHWPTPRRSASMTRRWRSAARDAASMSARRRRRCIADRWPRRRGGTRTVLPWPGCRVEPEGSGPLHAFPWGRFPSADGRPVGTADDRVGTVPCRPRDDRRHDGPPGGGPACAGLRRPGRAAVRAGAGAGSGRPLRGRRPGAADRGAGYLQTSHGGEDEDREKAAAIRPASPPSSTSGTPRTATGARRTAFRLPSGAARREARGTHPRAPGPYAVVGCVGAACWRRS
jgi:hypothetical protein